MKKYLLYSTLLSIFSEILTVKVGVDLKFIYCVVFVNYFVIAVVNKKILIPRLWLLAISMIFILGLASIFIYQNQFSKVAFQVFGITFMSVYFYNFFLCYDFDVEQLFNKYCQMCYIIAIIGIVLALFNYIVLRDFSYRAHGLFTEPAHFTGIMLPAYLYYIFNFKTEKLKAITLIAAFVMSFSSTAYLGILIGILMINKRINFFILNGLIVVSLLLGVIVYNIIPAVKLRVDDTFGVFGYMDVSSVNLSTYALVSNFYVTEKVLQSNFLTGHGIGSHPISHENYIYGLTGVESFTSSGEFVFNQEDANSLLLRILSELGILGAIGVFYFIFKNYSGDDKFYQISRGLLLYFIYKLLREGHYFSPEMYFFVFSYYFLKVKSIKINKASLKQYTALPSF